MSSEDEIEVLVDRDDRPRNVETTTIPIVYGYKDPKTNYKLTLLVWISRIIPISAAVICIAYIIYLCSDPANWITDPNSTDQEILDRESNRGILVSVLIAILMNIVGCFMFYIKVRESLVVTNYGFILGPVIGFMLDQAIGSDAGFRHFMTIEGIAYTFACLIGGNFMRYIVTVFLDLFISNPLQDILKTQVAKVGVLIALQDTKQKNKIMIGYDNFVALNFPSILQSIVAFVTFQAYTNQTRFAWAYPSLTLDRELRIPPGTIMLSTAIAGIVYLNFYTVMDYISEREYFDVNTKLMYVLLILALLYGLNFTDSIEAPVEGEYDKEYTKGISDIKPYLGMGIFLGFVLYGFVYPVWTRMGLCGFCKPTAEELEQTDHVAERSAVTSLRKDILKQVHKVVTQMDVHDQDITV